MCSKRTSFISNSQPTKLFRLGTPKSTKRLESSPIGTPKNNHSSASKKLNMSVATEANAVSSSKQKAINNNNNKIKTDSFYKNSTGLNVIETHGLVEWHQDGTFSVVSLNQIIKSSNMTLECDGIYDVKYNREKYKATLKIIGTLECCNEQLKLITEYNNICSTPSNNKKNLQPTDLPLHDFKLEVQMLKKSLDERDSLIKQNTDEIEELKNQLKAEKLFTQSLQETFSIEMKDKFMQMSKLFIQIFGSEDDLNDLEFIGDNGQAYTFLSSQYPQVKVTKQFKTEVDNLLNNPNNTASMVFRRIIQSLIPDEEVWYNGNRSKLFAAYESFIYAAFNFVGSVKKTFSLGECKALIRQLCNESRRKQKKKSLDPNSSGEKTIINASDIMDNDINDTDNVDDDMNDTCINDDSLVFNLNDDGDDSGNDEEPDSSRED